MTKKEQVAKQQKDKLYVVSAFSFLIVLFGLYVYFVSASILHVVMQQELGRQVSAINAEISQLESEYIKAQHQLSADIASRDGYVDASDKIFIRRSEAKLVLSSNADTTN